MTDGRFDTTIPRNLVRDLENKGVTVIVVGIGVPDPVQLYSISNNPNTVLNMMDPDKINSVAEKVKELACSSSNR